MRHPKTNVTIKLAVGSNSIADALKVQEAALKVLTSDLSPRPGVSVGVTGTAVSR